MSENVLQTLRQLVQDVIAPDVREVKVRLAAIKKQMDVRFDALEPRFKSFEQKFQGFEQKSDAQFRAIMAAIAESKAQSELTTMRLVSAPSERVAVLESRRP